MEGLAASIGSVGDAYDNAAAETVMGLYKNEAVKKGSRFRLGALKTLADVEEITCDRVKWYNNERLHSALGEPWRNGCVESWGSRLRDERLGINSFYSLLHARVVINNWKAEHNHDRRHSSLGYLTPVEYARTCTHQLETHDSHNKRA